MAHGPLVAFSGPLGLWSSDVWRLSAARADAGVGLRFLVSLVGRLGQSESAVF